MSVVGRVGRRCRSCGEGLSRVSVFYIRLMLPSFWLSGLDLNIRVLC